MRKNGGMSMKGDKPENWISGTNAERLRGWARDGLTMQELAEKLGIAKSTLYSWMKKNEQFKAIISDNKEVADRRVEESLYQSALDGNVTAMIFWLKNRKPGAWRDKRDLDVGTKNTGKLDSLLDELKDDEKDEG